MRWNFGIPGPRPGCVCTRCTLTKNPDDLQVWIHTQHRRVKRLTGLVGILAALVGAVTAVWALF